METKDRPRGLKISEHPIRPLPAYFRFLAEHRALVQQEHPNWNIVDVTKKCGQDWRNIDADLKNKYIEAYKEQNKKYTAALTAEQSKALTAARKKKKVAKLRRGIRKVYRKTGKPKRPMGIFLFFIKDKWTLPENKNKKLSEMLSTFNDEWRNVSKTNKEKYVQMHIRDKNRYEKEMAKWEAKMVEEGNVDIIGKNKQFIVSSKLSYVVRPKEERGHSGEGCHHSTTFPTMSGGTSDLKFDSTYSLNKNVPLQDQKNLKLPKIIIDSVSSETKGSLKEESGESQQVRDTEKPMAENLSSVKSMDSKETKSNKSVVDRLRDVFKF